MALNIESLNKLFKGFGFFFLVTAIMLGSSDTSFADVNPDGSISHTIPIRMPKGINGVQPTWRSVTGPMPETASWASAFN